MLKYRVTSVRVKDPLEGSSQSSQSLPSLSRSTSLNSISSIESTADTEWGILKIFTSNVTSFSDYKTVRVSTNDTVSSIISTLTSKCKTSIRDPNLLEMWMEVLTRSRDNDKGVRVVPSTLLLSKNERPLLLQRSLPEDSARFFVRLSQEGTLIRVRDTVLVPQSNYKTVVISQSTTSQQVIQLILQMDRLEDCLSQSLHLIEEDGEFIFPPDLPLLPLLSILPHCKSIAIATA